MSSMVHPKKERSIVPLFLTVFIDLLGFGIALPVLAVIFLDPRVSILPDWTPLGLRTFSYGLLVASYPFAQFFGAPMLGALSDRYGRKPLLMASLCGTAVSYVLFAIGIMLHWLPLLFISRLVAGFMGGNLSIAFSAVADISDGKKRTHNFGLMGMAFALGFIFGPYFGGKLADPTVAPWFGLDTPFWFAAAVTGINIVLCAWIFRETLQTRRRTPVSLLTGLTNFRRAFRVPSYRLMFTVVFLVTLGFNFYTQFFQVVLIDKFHFTEGGIGDFAAYTGLWIAITQGVLLYPVTKRFSSKSIFSWCSLLLGFAFPILLIPDHPWGLYVLVPFLAIFYGLSQPVSTALISDLSDKEGQGEIMGINQSVQAMAMAIPPVLGGLVAGVHLQLPIAAACILTFIGWYLFVRRYKEDPKHVFHQIRTPTV